MLVYVWLFSTCVTTTLSTIMKIHSHIFTVLSMKCRWIIMLFRFLYHMPVLEMMTWCRKDTKSPVNVRFYLIFIRFCRIQVFLISLKVWLREILGHQWQKSPSERIHSVWDWTSRMSRWGTIVNGITSFYTAMVQDFGFAVASKLLPTEGNLGIGHVPKPYDVRATRRNNHWTGLHIREAETFRRSMQF